MTEGGRENVQVERYGRNMKCYRDKQTIRHFVMYGLCMDFAWTYIEIHVNVIYLHS